ncbi:LOW QUALITY PROTEIN: hypothetical protein KUTeg_003421 [Tegillarca granosa]|uniref:Tyrosine-protein kinase ephrin type A/B receptor-like domain-containing protein n=1 Tax=Tegillarca granosa TaxID=220873 RepID=A0ABQ9FRJ1_TEGGR|nr:LOW QUALITY PROTEIN: hypothetical protein KUTeg_003421 [Tegillarca granosa]
MRNDIQTTFNSQLSGWTGVCLFVNSVCSTLTVTASCSLTQNMVADVVITVDNLSDTVSKGAVNYTPVEAFRVLVFIEQKFSYPNIGASVVVYETAVIEEFKSCGSGYAIVGQNCVQCPAGSYYDSTTYSCKFCGIGEYQTQDGQSSCNSCGGTKTTLKLGSSTLSDCVDKCLPGTFYNINKCDQCPLHHYQDKEGKAYCLGCPVGKKTSEKGSNSSADCYDDCPAGTELKLDGSCNSCPRGSYRSLQDDKCIMCATNFTTKTNGTTNQALCNIRICYAGTYRDANTNECQPCPVGQYQPEDLQDSCESCDPSYSTKDEGNVNKTSCIFYCKAGEEVESASEKKCRKCARGKYKDNTGNSKFDMCTTCPEGNTTVGEASMSLSDCRITYCSAGTFRNATTNQCEKCPFGQYTDKDLQEKCESCEKNYFTKKEGSDNKTACEYYCDPGKQLKDAASKLCEPCPRGFYRDSNVESYFQPCQECPVGNTTISDQSTSVDDCSILNCTKGQIINFYGGCEDCPLNTFQPDDSPTTTTKCQDCAGGTATKQEGSSASSQCEPFCTAGKQYNMGTKQCESCPKGTYNNGNETMKFESCAQCPENYTTPDSGSISVANCSLLDCDPGYKISDDSCVPCGFGYYNSKRHQTVCIQCEAKDTNTSTETSTNATDCLLHCPPGKSGSSSCETCQDGTIKPTAGLGECTPCTGNYTSNVNRTVCDVLYCDKGYYYNATEPICLPCEKGFYKENRGNSLTCNKCTDGLTTAGIAADASSKCDKKFCIKGKYYNVTSEECMPCAVGSYKDTVGNSPCISCGNNLTTSGDGATDQSQCSLIVCEAGQKRTDSKTCVNCERGTYQPERGMTTCIGCGTGKTTMNQSSKSANECVPLCKAGEEYLAATKNCSLCDFGSYKEVIGNDVNCTKCSQALKTTKNKGSTSSNQCTEDICGAGTKRVSNQGCVPCPRGEYQDKQEKTECIKCDNGKTTVNNGSTSKDVCILECADGKSYNYSTKTCVNCDIGWYTDKSKYCCKCIQCPDGTTTAYLGSNNCIQTSFTATTPAPRGKGMLKFRYIFKITLDCQYPTVRSTFIGLLKTILVRRLVFLRLTYRSLCNDAMCTIRSRTLKISAVTCGTKRYNHSKKRSLEENVTFDVEIPDIQETVTDNTGTGVKTNDFNANKNTYTQENVTEFAPQEISQGEFVKLCDTGDVLDITSNTCKPCPKGTYFSTSQTDCAINSGYCQNGGTCKKPVSNMEAILGGAIGGGAALLLIILLIECVFTSVILNKIYLFLLSPSKYSSNKNVFITMYFTVNSIINIKIYGNLEKIDKDWVHVINSAYLTYTFF